MLYRFLTYLAIFAVSALGFHIYPTCRQTVCAEGCRCIDTAITYIPRPRCVPNDCPIMMCYEDCAPVNDPTCRQTVCAEGCRCIDTAITYVPRPRCVPNDCPIMMCYEDCAPVNGNQTLDSC